MKQPDSFRGYLDEVCEQIRWKKAHPVICRELGDHLEDGQASLLASGVTEDEAAKQVVLDMGDSVLIGSQFDRVYRPRPAWSIILLTAVLMAIGFFARLYIVGHVDSFYRADIPRSLFWLCAAIIVLITGYFLDYTLIGKHPVIIGTGFLAVLIVYQWFSGSIYVGHYYMSYLMVLIPTVYAGILWWWPYQGYGGLIGGYLALVILAISGSLLVGSVAALFYGGVGGLMLTAELLKGRFGVRKSHGLLILYGPVVLFFVWLWNATHLAERLFVMLHPERDPQRFGYQSLQIRKVLAGARWIGSGNHTTDYVPELVNDHMLTYFIHQFGWIVLLIILLLFGALLAFSVVFMMKQNSRLGRTVSLAILLSLAAEGGIYIINNLGISLVGFTVLPLLSYGNASLLVDAFMIGLMLSVFRNNDIVRDEIIEPKRIPRIKITVDRLP